MVKLKYIDKKPIYFPRMSHYPGGLILPNKENIILVNDKEKNQLLKMKNGTMNCFEEIKERACKPEIKQNSEV